MLRILLSTVIVTLVLGQWLFSFSSSWAQVKFATPIRSSARYVLPVTAALEQGFWKNQGVEVKWVPFDSATTMNRAVAAGEIDMGSLGMNTIITAVSAGVPQVAVADTGISLIFHFWVRANSLMQRPEDLKGAKIGITRFGSETHAYTVAVLKALGLKTDVKLLSMGGVGPQIAGLKSGAIDVTVLSLDPVASLKVKEEVRSILKVNDYLPSDYEHLHMLYSVREFLDRHPAETRKIVLGFLQGGGFVMNNRSWTINKIMADFRYPQAAAELIYPSLRYDNKGKIDKTKVQGAIKFLVESDLLKRDKVPPLEKVIAEGFTP